MFRRPRDLNRKAGANRELTRKLNKRRALLQVDSLEDRLLMATRIWDGGGTDNLWTTAANWSGDVAPVANDDLTFPTSGGRYSPVNDFTNTTFGTITFGDYGYTVTGNPLNLTGGITTTYSGAFTSSLNTDVVLLSDVTISVGTIGLGLGGVISDGAGTFGLTLDGGGNLVLSGANTYDGTTTVAEGVISISNDQALGSTSGNTVVSGGSLYVLGGSPRTVAEDISLTGTGSGTAILYGINGDSTLTGNITIASHPGINVMNGSVMTLAGNIDDSSGTSALTMSTDSTSKLVVGGTNLYDGVTTISGGLVNITAAGALGDVSTSTTTTVATGASLEISGGISLPSTKAIRLNGTSLSGLSKLISSSGDNVIAGGVRLGNSQTVEVTADSLTISGVISQDDPFDLTKNGAGLLELSGVNTYTGTTTIDAGTLLLSGTIASAVDLAGGTLAGSGTISGGGIITSGTPTIEPGPIGGAGILTYSGSSDASLASGTTLKIDINGSTVGTGYDQLKLTNSSALFDPNGADLDVTVDYLPAVNTSFLIVSQTNTNAITGRFNGIAQFGSYTSGYVTFSVGYFASGVILTVTAVNIPTFTWDGGDGDDALWTSAENWVGDVAPTPGANLLFPASALQKANTNDFAADTDFNNITIEDSGYVLGGNSIDLTGDISATYTSGNSVITADIVLQSSRVISVADGAALSLASSVSGAFGLTKDGEGTLRIVGTTANTYTGATTVNVGTLVLSKTNGVDSIAGLLVIGDNSGDQLVRLEGSDQIANTADVTINEGATFDLNGQNETIDELTMRGATVQIPTGSIFGVIGQITTEVTTTDVTSTIDGLGSLLLDNAFGTKLSITVADDTDIEVELRINASITGGNRGLDKFGTGTMALAGASSSYENNTVANAGVILVESDGAIGNTNLGEVHSGASFYFSGSNLSITRNFNIFSGAGFAGGNALHVVSGSTTISGGIGLFTDARIGAADASTLTISGNLRDSSFSAPYYNLGVVNGATGRTILSGDNTGFMGLRGDITVDGGYLRVTDANAFGDGGTSATVTIGSGATLELMGGITIPASRTFAISGLPVADSSKIVSLTGDNSILGDIGITGGNSVAFDVASGTTLTVAGIISGSLDFDKNGTGTLVLTGTNTNTGAVNVGNGTMLVDGSLALASSVFVDGTLGGEGILPAVTISNIGTLSPGNSPGLLTTDNLTFQSSGSTFVVQVDGTTAGTGYDQVAVTGTVNLAGATLSLSVGFTPAITDAFTLIDNDFDDPVSGIFNGLAEGATITLGVATYTISYVGGDGNDVVLTTTDVTYTWDGGDADDSLWSSPDNWVGDILPTEGARLIFPSGAQRLSNLNDFAAGFDVYAIVVGASGYTLSGNGIDLMGGISATFGAGSSTVELDIALTDTVTFSVSAGGTLFANGAISGSEFGVTKTGVGILQYGGTVANTYLGTTTVVAGILQLNRPESVTSVQGDLVVGDNIGTGATVRVMQSDQIANGVNVTVNEGATLSLDAAVYDDFQLLTMQGSTVDLASGASLIPMSGLVTLATTNNETSNIQGDGSLVLTGTYIVDVADDPSVVVDLRISATLTNPESGSGALAKDGAGILAISGTNTYTGRTYAQAGILLVESAGAFGLGGDLLIFDGASMLFGGADKTFSNNFLLAAGAGFGGLGAIRVSSGNVTFTGSMSLGGDILVNAASSASLSLLGAIDDSDSAYDVTVTNGATGRTILGGNNSFDGNLTVTAGFLRLTNSGAAGNAGSSTDVSIDDGATLELLGGIATPAGKSFILTGNPVTGSAKVVNLLGDNAIGGDIELVGDSAVDVASGTTLIIGGYASESDLTSAFIKLGGGILNLTGNASYNGITLVTAGKVLVNSDYATSPFEVSSGATIGGLGRVGNLNVADGGTLSPGNSPAAFYSGNFSLATGSTFLAEVPGDLVDVTGTVNLDSDSTGGATLNLVFLETPGVGDVLTLINNDGSDAVVGIFSGRPEGSVITFGAATFVLSYVGGDGNDVVLTTTDVTYTWDGGDTNDSFWTSADNWVGNIAPTPRANLVFPIGAARLANVNNIDIDGFEVYSITIGAAGYSITGNAIILIDQLATTYASGISSIDLNILLSEVDLAAGTLEMGGILSGTLTILGPGTLVLDGAASNALAVTIEDGTLVLAKTGGAIALGGTLTVGTGATVRLGGNDQLADSVYADLFEGSHFDFNGFSDAFDVLSLTGATASIPVGSTFTVLNYIWSRESDRVSRIDGPGTIDLNGHPYVYFYTDDSANVDVDFILGAVLANGGVDYTYDYSIGTIAVTGANTYEGITYLEGSIVRVENALALGAPGNEDDGYTDVYYSSTLILAVPGMVLGEFLYLSDQGVDGSGVLRNEADNVTLNGGLSIYEYESSAPVRIGTADGTTLTIAGVISDLWSPGWSLEIANGATGRIILGGDNTYGGNTRVSSGFVQAANSNAFGDPATSAMVALEDGASLELSEGINIPATKSLYLAGSGVGSPAKLINLSGFNSLDGAVSLTDNTTIDVASDSWLRINGTITGYAATITKAGSGTLMLAADGTFTAGFIVSAGTLQVDGTIGLESTLVASGASLTGSGSVQSLGVSVSSGGTVDPGNSESTAILSTWNITFDSGSTFAVDLDGTDVGSDYDQLAVTGEVILDNSTLFVTIGQTPGVGDVFTIINNDGSDAVTGTFLGLAEGATIQMGAVRFTITYLGGDGNDVVLTASDVTYVWSGASDDGRDWGIGANWIGGVAPTPNSNLVFPNSPVRTESVNNFSGFAFHSITIAGAGYDIYGNPIALAAGINSTFGAGTSSFALDFEMLETQAIAVAAGGTLDLVGSISGFYKALIKEGAGTLILSGNTSNTYNTYTEVNAGTLLLNKTGAIAIDSGIVIGNGTSGVVVRLLSSDQIEGYVEIFEGSTFDLNGFSDTIGDLYLTEGTVLISAGSTLTVGGDITSYESVNNVISLISGPGTLDLDGENSVYIYPEDDPELDVELRISAVIANGGINIHDDGVVALSGANTYAGDTEIGDGGILVEHEQALGTLDGTTEVDSGSSLYFAGNLSIAETIRIYGEGLDQTGSLFVQSGTTTLSGLIEVYDDSQIGAADGSTLNITGEVFGYSGYSLTAQSDPTGRVILAGDNTYEDDTFVTGGILRAAHSNAFGKSNVSTVVTVGPGGTLEFADGIDVPATKSMILDEIQADGTSKLMNVSGHNSFAGPILFINRFQSIDAAAGTSLTLSGVISGTEALDKNGPGLLVLSGNSTFTGLTNVYTGTMLVNGDISTSAGVTVAANATLGGTGTVGLLSASANGTVAPGVTRGILTSGNAAFDSGAAFAVDLFGTVVGSEYDQLNVDGTVSLGEATLDLALGYTPLPGTTFTIVDNDGVDAIQGTFFGLAEGERFTSDGITFEITYIGGDGNDVVLTAYGTPTIVATSSTSGESVFGEPIVFTATVSGVGAVPTGTVTLLIDGTPVGTPALLVNGVATFPAVSNLSVGNHEISFLYSGNDDYVSGTDALPDGQVVARAGSTTSLASSEPSSIYGESITLTANVAPQFGGVVSGLVGFYDGETLLGTATLDDSGMATYTLANLPGGDRVLTARFFGDGNFDSSTSSSVAVTVAPASTTMTSSASPLTSPANTPITFTATLASQFDVIPTGLVRFYDGDTLVHTAVIDGNGVATFITTDLLVGTHTIRAEFGGDTDFLASNATYPDITVTRAESNAGNVTSSLPQTFYGQDVTLTANFSSTPVGSAPMTGTVDFYDGDVYLGSAQLIANGSAGAQVVSAMAVGGTVFGQASLQTSALSVGDHIIRAVYSGDANYSAAVSETPVSVQVDPATTATVLDAVTTPAGTTLTATVVVTSPGSPDLTGTMSFFDGETLLGTVPVANMTASLAIGTLSPGSHTFRAVFSGGGTSSASGSSVTVSTDGPKITGLSRFGIHAQRTVIVLNFDSSLDAARAQNVANYVILDSRGRRIAIASASYDPIALTVTLRPSQRLNLYKAYTLTVIGTAPGGLTGASGIALDGSGTDNPGTDFTARITWASLAAPGTPPAVSFANGQVQQYAGPFRRYVDSVIRATRAATQTRTPARTRLVAQSFKMAAPRSANRPNANR